MFENDLKFIYNIFFNSCIVAHINYNKHNIFNKIENNYIND